MRHPTDGTLRRLVDDPVGVTDAEREHADHCPECRARLDAVRADADRVAVLLGTGPGTTPHPDAGLDLDAAWARLAAGLAAPSGSGPVATRRPQSRWRDRLRSPVVAGVGVLALLAGGGVAAATDWFQVFRTEQVAPVTVTPADVAALAQLPDLADYGRLRVEREVAVREVADAAAAARTAGLPVPELGDLPRGVVDEPRYQVADQAVASFTFSAGAAARAAEAEGGTAPPVPEGLDGSTFRITVGPAVGVVWPSGSGLPGLVAGRAVAPSVTSDGVPFETARDYLLALPGLPDAVASQLRGLAGDGTTLPLVVEADEETATATEVDGLPATLLAARDGSWAGVVWVDGGEVVAVAGSVSSDEVLEAARGLGWSR